MKAIYKSAALLFGAMSLFSSCEDFLTRDPQDSYLLSDYLNSDAKLDVYTKQISGPLTWFGYDDKFSWCVGELYSGNVYHNYADEGQFHFMSFTANNAHISNGYQSLYGVIAKCNHIINDIPNIARENGLSETAINKAIGEAKMYRGMAYFLLAEYWGTAPIILDNAKVVSQDLAPQITKADRKSLYTLIEKDWKEAADLLPENAQSGCRVWKASAYGMLCKLYVTMASCQRDLGMEGQYVCDNPNEYYQKAIDCGNKSLEFCDYLEQGYENYDKMFQPGVESKEILFALLFEQGVYGQGCSRQIQFARSKFLTGGGDAYGGEKGLTTTLFDSYEKAKDIRLKATSYYWGPDDTYSDSRTKVDAQTNGGQGHFYTLVCEPEKKYYYFLNPTKSLSKADMSNFYGQEPNSAVFNHCRKFVYGIKPTNSPFSVDLKVPFLRVADVLLLVAEAKMGKENAEVSNASTAGIKEVNLVRQRAGLDPIEKIAFCVEDSVKYNSVTDSAVVVNEAGEEVTVRATCDKYFPTYDLMLERRHEFALENLCWLDIKRLYYRNEKAAVDYIKGQDRGCTYGEKFGAEVKAQSRADFQRQCLIHDLSQRANEKNPAAYAVQASEGVIEYDKLQFFLPVPASVPATQNNSIVKDYSEQIEKGEYPY